MFELLLNFTASKNIFYFYPYNIRVIWEIVKSNK